MEAAGRKIASCAAILGRKGLLNPRGVEHCNAARRRSRFHQTPAPPPPLHQWPGPGHENHPPSNEVVREEATTSCYLSISHCGELGQVSIRSAWVIRCVSGLQSKDGAIVHTKAEDATQHESGLRGHNGWRRKNDERKGFGRAPRISIPAIRTCQSGRTSGRVKTYPHTSRKKNFIPVVVVG